MAARQNVALVSGESQGCEENQEARVAGAAGHPNGVSGISDTSGIDSVDSVSSTDSAARERRVHAIKCLTLYQPYASLVTLGVKTIDTRSWRTWYRGALLIHAARSSRVGPATCASKSRSRARSGTRASRIPCPGEWIQSSSRSVPSWPCAHSSTACGSALRV